MAVASQRVTADVIEASEFPALSQQYAVSGVPKTIVNERVEILGARSEARFLAEVLAGVD